MNKIHRKFLYSILLHGIRALRFFLRQNVTQVSRVSVSTLCRVLFIIGHPSRVPITLFRRFQEKDRPPFVFPMKSPRRKICHAPSRALTCRPQLLRSPARVGHTPSSRCYIAAIPAPIGSSTPPRSVSAISCFHW